MSIRHTDEKCTLICDCCGLAVQFVGGIVSAQEARRQAERGPDEWASKRQGYIVRDLCGPCRAPGHGPVDHATPGDPLVLVSGYARMALSCYHEARDGGLCHFLTREGPRPQLVVRSVAEKLGYGVCSFCADGR